MADADGPEPAPSFSLEEAQAILAAQPFSALLGARVTELAGGVATLEIDIDERHRQQYGVLHGGVLAYLADNAITFAAGSVLGATVLTGGMTIDYLRTARAGVLRARAHVVHADSRHAVATAEVTAEVPDGEVRRCAVAQGTVLVSSRG
ncbi:MAG: PaaI family thioesterase [Nocardioides sp.]